LDNEGTDRLIFSAFNELLAVTPDPVFFKDMDFRYRMVSDSFVDIIGCSSRSEIIGKSIHEVFPDETIASRFISRDKLVIEGVHHAESYYELIPRKTGGQAYIKVRKSLLLDDDGTPIGIFGFGRDMTEEYESKLIYNSEIQSLFAMGPDCMASMILDLTTWRIISSAMRTDVQRHCYNFSEIDDFKAAAIRTAINAPDVDKWLRSFDGDTMLRLYNDGKRSFNMQYCVVGLGDAPKWVKLKCRLLRDPLSNHLTMVCQLIDIDDIISANGKLKKAAERDSMTGLLNHDTTLKQIGAFIKTDGSAGTHVLLMVDIDNFKQVNDNYGHQTGDDVLIHIADVLKKAFRADDIVGRIGGDEFMVLMKNCGSITTASRKVPELIENLQYSFTSGGNTVYITGSVGVSIYEANGKTVDQLYYEADSALYKVKASGKNGFAYSDSIEASIARAANDLKAGDKISAVHLKTLLENMDGSVVLCNVTDSAINFTYVSPSMFNIMNQKVEQIGIRGEHLLDNVHPDDRPLFREDLFNCMKHGCSINEFIRIVHPDADQCQWWHVRGSRIPTDDGPTSLLLVITDVTSIMTLERQKML
jgi:diguanylate cyclase (GGDEF)-like protein/PAS domain S-box-containing protein